MSESYPGSKDQEVQTQQLADEFFDMLQQQAEERGLTAAERREFIDGVIERFEGAVASKVQEEAKARTEEGAYGFFADLYREVTGQEDPERDWITQQQIRSLLNGEEPLDVLYFRAEDGSARLDPEYLPGVLALIMQDLEAAESLEAALPQLDTQRRRLLMDAECIGPAGHRHLPPAEVLAGTYGEAEAAAFAQGALDIVQRIMQSHVAEPKQPKN